MDCQRAAVALIGAGVIGASWAALFLAHGSRSPSATRGRRPRAKCATLIERSADALRTLGLVAGARPPRCASRPTSRSAVAGAEIVQENGPERLEFKQQLWPRVQRAARPGALLLSSSSAIPATEQATQHADASRLLVGHPFNPPHIMPLVEVVPGERHRPTDVMRRWRSTARSARCRRCCRRRSRGFVANRLQSAIFRECVSPGARRAWCASTSSTAIVTQSVGLRWAVDGPFAVVPPGRRRRRAAQLRAAVRRRAWKSAGSRSSTKCLRRSDHRAAVRAGRRGLRRACRASRWRHGATRADRDPSRD